MFPSTIIKNMEEINYIPGDKDVLMSFVVKGMRGEIYNIENFSSLSTVYKLKTILAEMTTYPASHMMLYCSGLMKDNFAIEYYDLGDGSKNVLFCPRLRGGARTRRTFRRIDVIIRDVSDSETE